MRLTREVFSAYQKYPYQKLYVWFRYARGSEPIAPLVLAPNKPSEEYQLAWSAPYPTNMGQDGLYQWTRSFIGKLPILNPSMKYEND